MAVTLKDLVLKMTAAGDSYAATTPVGSMVVVGGSGTGAFTIKNGAGDIIWHGDVLTAEDQVRFPTPDKFWLTGIEFDTVPTGAELYVYLR